MSRADASKAENPVERTKIRNKNLTRQAIILIETNIKYSDEHDKNNIADLVSTTRVVVVSGPVDATKRIVVVRACFQKIAKHTKYHRQHDC